MKVELNAVFEPGDLWLWCTFSHTDKHNLVAQHVFIVKVRCVQNLGTLQTEGLHLLTFPSPRSCSCVCLSVLMDPLMTVHCDGVRLILSMLHRHSDAASLTVMKTVRALHCNLVCWHSSVSVTHIMVVVILVRLWVPIFSCYGQTNLHLAL